VPNMGVTFIFSKYFLSAFLFLLLSYIAGDVVVNPFSERFKATPFFTRLFVRLIAGLTTFAVLYAVVCTSFKTINTGFLLLFFLYLFCHYREHGKINFKGERFTSVRDWKRIVLFLFASCVVFVTWEMPGFVKAGSFHYSLGKLKDFVYYADVSHYIKVTGEENFYASANIMSTDYSGATPYHYFELWLNDLAARCFVSNPLSTLLLVIFPVFFVTLYAGIMAIMEIYKTVTASMMVLAFLLMFCSGVFLSAYYHHSFLYQSFAYAAIPLFYFRKLSIYMIFFVAALLALHYKKPLLFFFSLLSLPLTSSDTMFGIAGCCGSLILFNFFFKIYPKQDGNKIKLLVGSTFLFIGLFYLMLGNKKIISGDMHDFFNVSQLLSSESVRRYISIFAVTAVLFMVTYGPWLITLWFLKTRNKIRMDMLLPQLFITAGITIFFSLCAWALLHRSLNYYQFFKNIAVAFSNSLVIFIIIKILFEDKYANRRKSFVGTATICVMLLFPLFNLKFAATSKISKAFHPLPNGYSDAYLEKVTNYLDAHPECNRGAAINSSEGYARLPEMPHPISNALGNYMSLSVNPVMATDIGVFNIHMEKFDSLTISRLKVVISQTPFSRFVEEQKHAGVFSTIEQSQADFINEKKIDFVIVAKNLIIPPAVKVVPSVQFTDEESGEQFFVLK
jgi:hypothetical protein